MTDDDTILVRVLAATDAVRLPVRDWTGNASVNRYFAQKAGGVPYRMGAKAEGDRKSGERQLQDLADAGLVNISRGSRVKFPLLSLTPDGDERARLVVGIPGRAVGRLFLAAVVERAAKYVETITGRWCPEIDLNGGKGWGNSTVEERRGLASVELDFLPAAAAGWVLASSTHAGQAAYVPTPDGLAELSKPTKPTRFPKERDADPEAVQLYRREQDAKLRELHVGKPDNTQEIGPLPLGGWLLMKDRSQRTAKAV